MSKIGPERPGCFPPPPRGRADQCPVPQSATRRLAYAQKLLDDLKTFIKVLKKDIKAHTH